MLAQHLMIKLKGIYMTLRILGFLPNRWRVVNTADMLVNDRYLFMLFKIGRIYI